MQLSCPKCGTREVRVSARQGFGETLRAVVGVTQLRCRRCRARWETSVWEGGAWKFARCPRCYRQNLSTWSMQYYRPPMWIRLKLQAGATPYRCGACRCNFASFLPCREKFSWRQKAEPTDAQDLSALGSAVGPSVQGAASNAADSKAQDS